MSAAEVWQIFN